MKSYAVLQKIGNLNATVIREVNDLSTAFALAQIMQETENGDHIKYFVAQSILPADFSGNNCNCMPAE